MISKQQTKYTAAQTIFAGGAAGGLESLITFPTEDIKTQRQLLKTLRGEKVSLTTLLIDTVRQKGIPQLYSGVTVSKSAIRFFTFDFVRHYLPHNGQNKTTTIGDFISGFVAGVTESLTVITPGETLKTSPRWASIYRHGFGGATYFSY